MRPVGGDWRLQALEPTLTRDGAGLPVDCEVASYRKPPRSFMAYWKPSWRDLWELLLGSRVRVSVNYGIGGPLFVDVAKDAGYIEGVDEADIEAFRQAERPSPRPPSGGGE